MELLVNNGTTTLAESLDNSTDPLSFDVTDASVFPATGDFRVRVDNEILLVTAVSSNTLTASRAQEGTTIASHSNGAGINFTLSKGSLQRVIGEFAMVGDGSDRPSADVNGRSYQHTDQPLIARVVSGAWRTFYGTTGPFTPTLSGDFSTWVNQSTYGYVTDATDSFLLGDTGGDSGDQPRMRMAAMSGDAQLTLAFLCFRNPQADNNQFGIVIRESGSGKHYRFCFQNTDGVPMGWNVYRYTTNSNFDTTMIAQANVIWGSQPVFMRVQHIASSTTLKIFGSVDYINWREMYSFSYSSFFTPDQIGPYCINYSTPSGIDCYMNILSAELTP